MQPLLSTTLRSNYVPQLYSNIIRIKYSMARPRKSKTTCKLQGLKNNMYVTRYEECTKCTYVTRYEECTCMLQGMKNAQHICH